MSDEHPRPPAEPGGPHSVARSTAALLGFQSSPCCLMSAFATTLGMFNLLIVFLWCLCLPSSLFYLLAGALSLATLAQGVFQTFQPSCLPSGWLAPGDGASPSVCRPQGAHLQGSHLAKLNIFNEAAVGCGGKSEVNLLLQKGRVLRSTWLGGCRRGVHTAPGPAHIQTHLPAGILTLDDMALFVNMLLIHNFENKIETSCVLKYKMKCGALYTI